MRLPKKICRNQQHLLALLDLSELRRLSLVDSDFFSHNVFWLLQSSSGAKLLSLRLEDVDEMNVNALAIIGRECKSLKELSLARCHFQVYIYGTVLYFYDIRKS